MNATSAIMLWLDVSFVDVQDLTIPLRLTSATTTSAMSFLTVLGFVTSLVFIQNHVVGVRLLEKAASLLSHAVMESVLTTR